ncbi:MAG: hypothetical protein K940chlam5_01436, partial [Candidatus Anoxychlamydiales bacterium]|nr:hypothetical protein [Candidatus Anoxychlamydiales bacterium]
DYLKSKLAINIFISHAVIDFETYRIKDLAEFLEQKDEVYRVYYCEEDLVGNIDWFMKEVIPSCNLVLFLGTAKSIHNSVECLYELELARKHYKHIIPIKGIDISWKDMRDIGLSREIGLEFDMNDLHKFSQELYQFICKFKRKTDLVESDLQHMSKSFIETRNLVNQYINSLDFRQNYVKYYNNIQKLNKEVNTGLIGLEEFMIKLIQLSRKEVN